jgi:hypothetical protein
MFNILWSASLTSVLRVKLPLHRMRSKILLNGRGKCCRKENIQKTQEATESRVHYDIHACLSTMRLLAFWWHFSKLLYLSSPYQVKTNYICNKLLRLHLRSRSDYEQWVSLPLCPGFSLSSVNNPIKKHTYLN